VKEGKPEEQAFAHIANSKDRFTGSSFIRTVFGFWRATIAPMLDRLIDPVTVKEDRGHDLLMLIRTVSWSVFSKPDYTFCDQLGLKNLSASTAGVL
jgi:hypothetical protein